MQSWLGPVWLWRCEGGRMRAPSTRREWSPMAGLGCADAIRKRCRAARSLGMIGMSARVKEGAMYWSMGGWAGLSLLWVRRPGRGVLRSARTTHTKLEPVQSVRLQGTGRAEHDRDLFGLSMSSLVGPRQAAGLTSTATATELQQGSRSPNIRPPGRAATPSIDLVGYQPGLTAAVSPIASQRDRACGCAGGVCWCFEKPTHPLARALSCQTHNRPSRTSSVDPWTPPSVMLHL